MSMKNGGIIQSEGKCVQYSAILRFFWSIAKICRSIAHAIPAIYKLPPMTLLCLQIGRKRNFTSLFKAFFLPWEKMTYREVK